MAGVQSTEGDISAKYTSKKFASFAIIQICDSVLPSGFKSPAMPQAVLTSQVTLVGDVCAHFKT